MNRSYSKIRHIQEANQRLEKRLVENVIVEGDVNEQFPPAVSGLVKGVAKKIGQYADDAINYFKKPAKTPQYFSSATSATPLSVPKNVPPALGNVLHKFSIQKWDQTLNSALQTVRDEVFVLSKNLSRLESEVTEYGLLRNLKMPFNDLRLADRTGSLTMAKGNYDFYRTFQHFDYMKGQIDELIASKKVSPKALEILEVMKKDVDDAVQKLQTVFLDTLKR
jgi:hypothetical protein